MKFKIQFTCGACRENFLIDLRNLGKDHSLWCLNCGRMVPVSPEQVWQLLRRLREEIRHVTIKTALARGNDKGKVIVGP